MPAFESSAFDAGAFDAAVDGHAVYPVNVRPKKRTSHLRPSFFAPVAPPAVPAFGALIPERAIVNRRRSHLRPSAFRPATVIADTVVPPVGPAGVATFAISVEDGATIKYAWPSVVRKMSSGIETRASLVRTPRQHFEWTSLLSDAQFREVTSLLQQHTANAPTFLLGLPYEEVGVVSSTSSTITVTSLSDCDWAVAGQRIVVVGLDGVTVASTWISGPPTGATIPTGSDVSALALDGARVMPALAVILEADQGFERERVGLGRWQLAANAAQNGYGATTAFGVDAVVTTHDGIPVWDRGIVAQTAAQPLLSDVSPLDDGIGVADAVALRALPDWLRAVRAEASTSTDWQWFKAFLMTVRGRSRTFLLPTNRPDLVAESDASTGTLTISGADYVSSWWPSQAHRRIRIVFTDGTFVFRTVTAAVDNGDGTQDLTLASAAAGTIDRVELLELVRLRDDEIAVKWRDYVFESSFNAQVVQQ